MKNLIVTSLIFALAGFGSMVMAQPNSDNASATATANVLQPVSVTQVTNLEFGDVFQGTNSSVGSASGASFDVTATSGESVTLDFTLPNEGNSSSESNTYWLDEDGGGTDELTITFSTTDANWETGTTHSGSNTFDPSSTTSATLDSDGIRVWLGGTVEPSGDQTEGTYTGSITLTATYN